MDTIKFVIDELNQAPFNQNLNLIGYDNLRSEQRLDILIQILNVIDPKLNLVSVRVGNIEEIVTTILDTLRIFKYPPPLNQINPGEFRKNLILADKDLLTNIFEWLLKRLTPLKKRAYLARFLVKVELSAEVEGDHDVLLIYKQYLRLIEEFKKTHSAYESQKKSLDSIIELQKDIKTMEIEKDQIKNKLNMVQRRVNLDANEIEHSGSSGHNSSSLPIDMFEAVKRYVTIKHENDKLQRQLREQNEKIENFKNQIELQQNQLNELRISSNDLTTGNSESPETMLERVKEDVSIKERLAKDVLPAELNEMRSLVQDIEGIHQQSDMVVKEYLSKVTSQIQSISDEINEQMEKKLLEKDSDEDRLSHYRQNAQSVVEKKERTLKKFLEQEKIVKHNQMELEELRAQFNDGDLPLRGEALKLYIEKLSKRDVEMEEKNQEVARLRQELESLETKASSLKQQETDVMSDISNLEESLGIDGYFLMRENTLKVVVDDNDDGIEDDDNELTLLMDSGAGNDGSNFKQINSTIASLQEQLDQIKGTLTPLTKEVKQLKQTHHELENDYDMRKRLYDSAAAGLETELSRNEEELNRLKRERDQLDNDRFVLETRLMVYQVERTHLTASHTSPTSDNDNESKSIVDELKKQVDIESELQKTLLQRQKELEANEDFYRKQIEMWRDLKALFETKYKILAQKQEDKARNDYMISANYNHLVLN